MALTDLSYLDEFSRRSVWAKAGFVAALFAIYLIALAVYRLYLAPVSKFPGPKLAALTYWYEFYYDVIKDGQYQWQIERLHDRYGPVIRINPYELHVMDPDFYDVLYTSGNRRRDKWPWMYETFGIKGSSFSTLSHELHRMRRAPLNPSFSKKSVYKLEDSIRECVEILCKRFRDWQQSQLPLRIRDAYAALSLDVIMDYCFANSADSLNHPDFDRSWICLVDGLLPSSPMMRQFPWIMWAFINMPDWLTLKLSPSMASLFNMQNVSKPDVLVVGLKFEFEELCVVDKLQNIRARIIGILNSSPEDLKNNTSTVFHRMLQSDLPPAELKLERMRAEGQVLVGAGQLTTADSLERATFELLSHPETLAKLRAELESAIPNSSQIPSLQKLEQLPYLSAVLSESLRISTPVTSRLQRIAPDEDLTVAGYTIPAGVPIGMSCLLMHFRNPHFPDANEFKPERWLVPQAERTKLEKYLVPFGKGSRMCLGMHLAEAELRFALAAVFRRFDFKIYQTTLRDIEPQHDYITALPYHGSERLRVIVEK